MNMLTIKLAKAVARDSELQKIITLMSSNTLANFVVDTEPYLGRDGRRAYDAAMDALIAKVGDAEATRLIRIAEGH